MSDGTAWDVDTGPGLPARGVAFGLCFAAPIWAVMAAVAWLLLG